jgi:competence protein ComEC
VAIAGSFLGGVYVGGWSHSLAAAPVPWLAGAVAAVLMAVGLVGRARRVAWLVAAALAGGGATAWAAAGHGAPVVPDHGAVDDRAADTLVGRVGQVVDEPTGRIFRLTLEPPAHAVVEVTIAPGRDGQAPLVLPGDRVRVRARLRTPRGYRSPGAFDVARAARRRGVDLVASASAGAVTRLSAGASLARVPRQLQLALVAAIDARAGSGPGRAILRAMVAGDRARLADEVEARFRDAGIAHILSVSGLHLAATALLVFGAVRTLWAAVPAWAAHADPTRVAAACAAPAAVLYTLMTGAAVPTVRALIVALVALAGAVLRRRPRVLEALALAALVLVGSTPGTLHDPSFQLSFVATLTLALVARGLAARMPCGEVPRGPCERVGAYVRGALWAAFWVTLTTAPITAGFFGVVQTGGLVANLLAVPLCELVVLPLGLAGGLLALLWPAGGGVLLDGAIAGAAAIDRIAGAVAAIGPVVDVPAVGTGLLLGAGVAAGVALLAWCRQSRRLALAAALGLALLTAFELGRDELLPAPAGMTVTFLDVGQGDAAVVELPGGGAWLIDGGGEAFVVDEPGPTSREDRAEGPGQHAVVPFLRSRRITRLGLVILSHPHPDHYLGLCAVARTVAIDELWLARPHPDQPLPPLLAELLADLARRGTRIVHPHLGVAHRQAGATLTVLWPRYQTMFAEVDPVLSINDNSLVVRLDYAGRRVLFPGDLEAEGEELLVAAAPDLAVDVVKVAHHGSATSSTPTLLAATTPIWAIISCGVANRFHFPRAAVVSRFTRAGARVFRTDRHGAITLRIAPTGDIALTAFD